MLIKHKDNVINLENVTELLKDVDRIRVNFNHGDCSFLPFESSTEMNKAFEKILNDHNWQRTICDLDRMDKKD